MPTSVYTGPQTFTEIDERTVQNQFDTAESLIATYRGMEVFYNGWVPSFGSPHPNYPFLFLSRREKSDAGGGLLDVRLTYTGTEQQSQIGGVYYSNLVTNTQLVAKNFSWEGVALVNSVIKQVTFQVQYWTIEATFTYTSYSVPTGGLFISNSRSFVHVVNAYWTLLTAPPNAGIYSGFPTVPSSINPQLVLSRFTSKPNSPKGYDISETWALDFNLGTLGIPNQTNYTF